MVPFVIRPLYLNSSREAKALLARINVDPYGIEAMVPKMIHINILLEGISCKVANIIKQEMLAIGGDAAVSRGTVACIIDQTDVLLMGTLKQITRFTEKVAIQPFNLDLISRQIKMILKNMEPGPSSFQTARRRIPLGKRTLIMGILNVTPDSFSDGGRWKSTDEAVEAAMQMIEDGADIIDIGGESTRPGSDSVSLGEEKRRVIPVIEQLMKKTDVPISIDTMKAEVARAALNEGVEIVNDVSALRHDKEMLSIISKTGAGIVLMHMRGTPKGMQSGNLAYGSLLGEILSFLKNKVEQATGNGIHRDRIMIDPGIGFGKKYDDNLILIKHLKEFKTLGMPIMVGASRKSFIGAISGGLPQDRDEGTAAAVTVAIQNGCNVIRVHNVSVMKKVAVMADALRWA